MLMKKWLGVRLMEVLKRGISNTTMKSYEGT
jgi:hypothetical protein